MRVFWGLLGLSVFGSGPVVRGVPGAVVPRFLVFCFLGTLLPNVGRGRGGLGGVGLLLCSIF